MHPTPALPAELTIYTVGELRTPWLGWLARPTEATDTAEDELLVDASAVDQVDAAGVQLLASLSASCKARQLTLRLQQPSQSLRAACATLGLERLLAAESTGADR